MSAAVSTKALGWARGAFEFLSSLKLACVLLVLLGVLVWLGTLAQVEHGLYEVQKKYFESFALVHYLGPVPIPLPGANLVLCVLFVNLICGGMLRLRKSRATLGVLVAHVGIAMLLVAGFVKNYHSADGHVTLYEGQRASHFQSYYRLELAVTERAAGGSAREFVAPEERFAAARAGATARIESAELPFALEVQHLFANARPLPKGPMFEVAVPIVDGVFLSAEKPIQTAEQNLPGCYVTLVPKHGGERRNGILWVASSAPFSVDIDGQRFEIELRRERYPLPFTLRLDDFEKEDHPRLSMPRSFQSDVTVFAGATEREARISMNEPLRSDGLVVYQASWGPANAREGARLFSTFAVVRNPADQWPLYACWVIAVGLVLHFARKLTRHVRLEARRA